MKQRPAGFVILMSVIVLSLKISRRLNVLHELRGQALPLGASDLPDSSRFVSACWLARTYAIQRTRHS